MKQHAADALGSCFSSVPNKDAAWSDLVRLTQNEDNYVKQHAADALGSCFPSAPNKDTAWSDLHRLTQNKDSFMRMSAYHSLGSASVYKATESKNNGKFKDELKIAIDYFECSSRESNRAYNPARFCLPFYRSYYAIISKQEAEVEVTKYLDEAKNASGRSEGRETLLKAVENLANALKEAQKPLDFDETKEHLRACRQYCDHTAQLVDSTREKSPVAAAAIERGIPIVGVKVKEIIAEIQEKAKESCQQAKGTPAEGIACALNQEIQERYISNQNDMEEVIEDISSLLKLRIPQIPQYNNIHEQIEKIGKETDMVRQGKILCHVISMIPTTIILGDNIDLSDAVVSDHSQINIKSKENKNASDNASVSKKSLLERINAPVTFGGFIGFVSGGIGSYVYPTQPISLIGIISVGVAVFAAIIFSIFNKE